jgi:nitrite reductase (NADH) small subunit
MSAPELTSHRLGPVAAIPLGEGRAYAVDGVQIAVFRLRNGSGNVDLRAMQALCPHAGGPLADGQADRAKVICPLHNYAFSVADGTCLNGDFAVRLHPVHEESGELVVDL